jgi:hypothetical protein
VPWQVALGRGLRVLIPVSWYLAGAGLTVLASSFLRAFARNTHRARLRLTLGCGKSPHRLVITLSARKGLLACAALPHPQEQLADSTNLRDLLMAKCRTIKVSLVLFVLGLTMGPLGSADGSR